MSRKNNEMSWWCHNAADVPKGPHWAIMKGASVTIPGDERSRTNPGHGYPESTEHYMEYRVFLIEEEFKKELQKQIEADARYGGPKSVGLHVGVVYESKLSIAIAEAPRAK